MPESRLRNLALGLLLVRRCEVLALKRFTLPEPVTEKRFLALELVFTLGMIMVLKTDCKGKTYLTKPQLLDYFFTTFLGATTTCMRLPSNLGRDSAAPYSSNSFRKRSKISSPRSLKTIALPLNCT